MPSPTTSKKSRSPSPKPKSKALAKRGNSPRRSRSPSPKPDVKPSAKPLDKPLGKSSAKPDVKPTVKRRGQGKFFKSVEHVRDGHDLKIVFQGEEMDPTFVNGLRRIMIAEIGTYSLSKNLIPISNTSIAFKNNECLIDRFALMPIFIRDRNKMSFLDEGLVFYVCAKGDPDHPLVNEEDHDLEINAWDLQIFDQEKNPSKYSIKELIIYNQPLLKLRKGEEFHFKGEIAKGVGHYNTTFKGCKVVYKYENEVSLNPTDKKKSPITGKPLETLQDKRNFPVNRWGNPQHISLTLKPIGHYDPEVCFELALETLEQKLLILQNLLGNPRQYTSTKLEIIPDTNVENRILIKIEDLVKSEEFLASHTIGEMVCKHMYYKLVDKVKGDMGKIRESLVAFRRMHRLDPVVILDIKTPPGLYPGSDNPALQLINETIDDLLSYVNQLKAGWGTGALSSPA